MCILQTELIEPFLYQNCSKMVNLQSIQSAIDILWEAHQNKDKTEESNQIDNTLTFWQQIKPVLEQENAEIVQSVENNAMGEDLRDNFRRLIKRTAKKDAVFANSLESFLNK